MLSQKQTNMLFYFLKEKEIHVSGFLSRWSVQHRHRFWSNSSQVWTPHQACCCHAEPTLDPLSLSLSSPPLLTLSQNSINIYQLKESSPGGLRIAMKKTRSVICRERVRLHGYLETPGVERLRSQCGTQEKRGGAGGDDNCRVPLYIMDSFSLSLICTWFTIVNGF